MTDEDDEIPVTPIRSREAQSGLVSYAAAVVLHESSRTRVAMVPYFIPHNTRSRELGIKIVTYAKDAALHGWRVREEKSLSLGEDAARALLAALKTHLAVAGHDTDGDFIAIRVAGGVADVADVDPSAIAQAVADILRRDDIVEHLVQKELGSEILNAFRGAIRLQELRSAVTQLRQHLDAGTADESVYQAWCDRHSWAFGNAYVARDELRAITAGDRIDLILPTVVAGYRDIVELKRPDMEVLRFDSSHRNYYFSRDSSAAIGQCHRYLDVLHEEATRGLRDHPEIVAYHPRATIVIGRSEGWDEEKLRALHGLNRRLNGITVMTYDQLLAQGERLVSIVTSERSGASDEYPQDSDDPFDWEDIPF